MENEITTVNMILTLKKPKELPCEVCGMLGYLEVEYYDDLIHSKLHETCSNCKGKGLYKGTEFEIWTSQIKDFHGHNWTWTKWKKDGVLAEEVYKILPHIYGG